MQPLFRITHIPANTYPNQPGDIATLGVPAILMSRSDVPSSVVHALAASLFVSGRYDPYAANTGMSIPMHAGAHQWYEEAGIYRKQSIMHIEAVWLLPLLVVCIVLVLGWKLNVLERFVRMKDIPRVGITLVVVWIIGTAIMYFAERKVNDYYGTPLIAAWSTLMNWISFGSKEPFTSLGRMTSLVMTILGFGGVLWLMAETAAIFIHIKLKGGRIMSDDHCVIINWNEKGPGIVEQLRSPELPKRQIVIITRGPADRKDIVPEGNGIRYIFAESITEDVLKRANVQEAHSVIILADKDGAHGVGP